MKGNDHDVLSILMGSSKRYFIPVYQRKYSWDTGNCERLFFDTVRLTRKEDKDEKHFFGSIVDAHLKGGNKDDFIIIDGQQRLTTVSLMLIALRKAIKNGKVRVDDSSISNRIWNDYLVDVYKNNEPRLILTDEDAKAYEFVLNDKEDKFIDGSTITENFNDLYSLVCRMPCTADELYNAIGRLLLIEIYAEGEDDAQQIFESINSLGKPLAKSDLIRNYMLMNLTNETQKKFYDDYWKEVEGNIQVGLDKKKAEETTERFFRDFLSVKNGAIPRFDEIYDEFKDYVRDKEKEEVFKDLVYYSKLYKILLKTDSGDAFADRILKRLNTLEMTVSYPYLVNLLEYREKGNLKDDEFEAVLQVLETYAFRRQVCGKPSNALNKIFLTLHNEVLRLKEEGDTYSSVLIFVLESKVGSGAFPGDDMFKEKFATADFYNAQTKSRLYLFSRLEVAGSKEGNEDHVISLMKQSADEGKATIEHIMPRTLTDAWKQDLGPEWQRIYDKFINTIANLTLSSYNPDYQNYTFINKKTREHGYNDSHFSLNDYLKTCDKWTETELLERQQRMVKLAMKLWPYPISEFKPKENEAIENHTLAEDFDFLGYKLLGYTFRGTPMPAKSWKEAGIAICKELYADNPESMMEAAANSPLVTLAVTPTEFSTKIAEGVYVDWNIDNIRKVMLFRYMLDTCAIQYDELSFKVINTKILTKDHGEEESGRFKFRREYWQAFLDYARDKEAFTSMFKNIHDVYPDPYYSLRYKGLAGTCEYVLRVSIAKHSVASGLYINKTSPVCTKVLAHKSEIEKALDAECTWRDTIPTEKSINVMTTIDKIDVTDESLWEKIFEWYIQNGIALYSVLKAIQ